MICVLSVIYCAVWVAVSATVLAALLCQFLARGCKIWIITLQKFCKSAIMGNRKNNTDNCVK